MGGQRAAISAKSEVAPGRRHRVSPTAWRTPPLLSPQGGLSFSLWRGGVGCFIGALLCPIDSAGTVAALCAQIRGFFLAGRPTTEFVNDDETPWDVNLMSVAATFC